MMEQLLPKNRKKKKSQPVGFICTQLESEIPL